MNRLSVALLFGIIICSMAMGALATRVNYRVLPFGPIVIRPQQENNETIHIEEIQITALETKAIDMTPFPQLGDVLTEFKQGDLMGIFLSYSFTWNKNYINYSATGPDDDTYVTIDGYLSAHFVTTLTIYDPNGEIVADDSKIYSTGGGSTSGGKSQTIRQRHLVEVPFNWELGDYKVEAYVEEALTGLEDSKGTSLTILFGSPAEVKYPWPIAAEPENFALKLNDLPAEGWSGGDGTTYSPILKDFFAGYEAFFPKTIENLEIGSLYVLIEQYESPDAANITFNRNLEMRIQNEKAGDERKVIMEEVGEKGYLVDIPERRSIESPFWKRILETTPWIAGATGSAVIFIKENIIVTVSCIYRTEAMSQGLYITNEELIQIAKIQAAKIVP